MNTVYIPRGQNLVPIMIKELDMNIGNYHVKT